MSVFIVYLFIYSFFFAGNFSKTAEPIFTKSSRKMANGFQYKIVKLLFSVLLLGLGERFKMSLSLYKNATWR